MAGCVTIVDVCACVQVSGLTVSLNQNWYWYNSTVCARTFGHVPDGTPNDDQNSGAYVSSTIGGEAVNTYGREFSWCERKAKRAELPAA